MQLLPSRRFLGLGLLAIALASATLPTSSAQAGVLWYNGDNDNIDAATNVSGVPINVGGVGPGYFFSTTLVYNDFVVPVGQTWSITGLFSNDQIAFGAAPTNATWEIRSGLSAGSGGSLIANSDTAATVTALPPVPGYDYIDPEYRVSTTISAVTLTAGTYWLAVAPDSQGFYADQSYVETTSGANGVGIPGGGNTNSFINNDNPVGAGPLNFVASNVGYSMGVSGTFTALAVPEPASWVLLAAGLSGAPYLIRRHRLRSVKAPTA